MKILVTGASGTLGRVVCRDLIAQGHEVVAFSRNHGRQLTECPGCTYEVGRVEDYHAVIAAFRKHKPDGVIHAAANKHVAICEKNPSEAIGSIIHGAMNVLRAIEEEGTPRAIFISSDKACHREQVYGLCKYLMEGVVREYGERLPHSKVNSLRFGNIFGSSGSVIPIWLKGIREAKEIKYHTFYGDSAYRFALKPSEASKFCRDVFFNHDYEQGSVLIPSSKIMKTIKIGILSRAMLALYDTQSEVNVVERAANPGESQYEWIYTAEESRYIMPHGDILELRSQPCREATESCRTGDRNKCSLTQTIAFVKEVVAEMQEWT